LRPEHVDEADLVVAMAGEHRDAIASAVPDAAGRTFTLKELVRLLEALPEAADDASLPDRIDAAAQLRRTGSVGNPHDDDIVDPLGMPVESFRAVAWELGEWIERLVDGLVGRASARAVAEGG
jgi:protein-tyrosine phosphatase